MGFRSEFGKVVKEIWRRPSRDCCQDKREAAGFTLIEVVVSLFLVYFLAGMLLNTMMVGKAGVNTSHRQTVACTYASSLLEEIKAYPEYFIVPGKNYALDSREAGFVTVPPEGMTAQLEFQPMGNVPGVYRVMIHVIADQGASTWEECLLGYVRMDPESL